MNVNLDTRGRIEYPAETVTDGVRTVAWTLLAVIWLEKQDVMPSRSEEAVKLGVVVAAPRARIRYRYRTDVDSSMRIVIRNTAWQIFNGPAAIGGRHEYSEVMAEAISV